MIVFNFQISYLMCLLLNYEQISGPIELKINIQIVYTSSSNMCMCLFRTNMLLFNSSYEPAIGFPIRNVSEVVRVPI